MALVRVLMILAIGVSACTQPGTGPQDAQVPEPDAVDAEADATLARTSAASADPRDVEVVFRRRATGLTQPVALAAPGDGTGRLFILEKRGVIKIFRKGSVRSRPFLNISGRVNSSGSEQGLLGMAFHPNFKQNRFFFVSFTASNGALRVVRFRAGSTYTSNRANKDTARRFIQIPSHASNHNGGELQFGSRFLFISTGDGGGGGDPPRNAQDVTSLNGKILRINVDRRCGSRRYCNPKTNPFRGSGTTGRGEIYHYGLRNPWRFSFDRRNGSMWIADVGQSAWEEINRAKRGVSGLNFGWDCREGREAYSGSNSPSAAQCQGLDFKEPLRVYANTSGRCAVIGGYVVRGSAEPDLRGIYVYADHCSGEVWGIGRADGSWRRSRIGSAPGNVTAFGLRGGSLFAANLQGNLYRVRAR